MEHFDQVMAEDARNKPEGKRVSNSVDLEQFEQYDRLSSAQNSLSSFFHPNNGSLDQCQSVKQAQLLDDLMRAFAQKPRLQHHGLHSWQPILTLNQLGQNRFLLESNAIIMEYVAQMMLTDLSTHQRLRVLENELQTISSQVHQSLLTGMGLQNQQGVEFSSSIVRPPQEDRPPALTSDTLEVTVPSRSGRSHPMLTSRIPPKKSKKLYWGKRVGRKWKLQYDKLVRYQAQCGSQSKPLSSQADSKLVSWVGEQRKQYKCFQRGIETPLTQARIDLLDEIGFVWNAHEAAWDGNFQELVSFHKTYGTWTILPAEEPGCRKLSLWVKEQRRQKKLLDQGKPSHISVERIRRLEDAGFCFDPNRTCKDSSEAR